jgi:hypothetical protein
MNKIYKHFRDAAALCNDYRDSILYTSAAGLVAFNLSAPLNCAFIAMALWARELTRVWTHNMSQ